MRTDIATNNAPLPHPGSEHGCRYNCCRRLQRHTRQTDEYDRPNQQGRTTTAGGSDSPPLTTRLLQWWHMITGGSSLRHLSPHSTQVCPWQSWHEWLRDLAHPSSSFPTCFENSCCRRGNKGRGPKSVAERAWKRTQDRFCQQTPESGHHHRISVRICSHHSHRTRIRRATFAQPLFGIGNNAFS